MKTFQTVFFLFALSAGSAQAQASPLNKVFELIDNLKNRIVADGEKEQQAYQKYFDYCRRTSKDVQNEVTAATSLKGKLTAKIDKLGSDIEVSETKIGEQGGSTSKADAELKEATSIREKEAEEFVEAEKELMTTVDTLERALSTLEKQLSAGQSFAQIDYASLLNIVQTLSVVDDAAAMEGSSMDKLTSLIQAHDDDDDMGAPSAAAYKKQSGSIMDVLEDMKDKAENQLSELRKNELKSKNSYELLKQGLDDEIKASKKEMQDEQANKAANGEEEASATGNLAIAKQEKSSAEKHEEETSQDCQTAAANHEANVAARREEVKVIEQAEKILKESTGSVAEDIVEDSFLQLAASSKTKSASSEVVRLVQNLAKQHHSASLAQLASRISAQLRYSSARHSSDPFKKVKELIVNMINKLEKQASAEATEKAYCDEEMSKTASKHSELEDEIAKLAASIGKSAAESSELKEEVSELSMELSQLAKEQAEMDAIRMEASAAAEHSKKDLERGLGGVRKALSVLRDFYANEDQTGAAMLQEGEDSGRDDMSSMMQHAARQPSPPRQFVKSDGAGQGIIGILEVCESDLAKNLATEDAEETDAQSIYEKQTQSNKVSKAEKQQDAQHKTAQFKALDKAISEQESDKVTQVTEFNAVNEYFSKVKERCVAKPLSYDELKARRDAEIQGLKEAMASLESSAFAQISPRHHTRGNLRGETLRAD